MCIWSAESTRRADLRAPAARFDDRADDYRRFRPGYPAALAAHLRDHAGVGPDTRVADAGAGTGLSSRVFIGLGCEVWAVEPNAGMRAAAAADLAGDARFHPVAACAEATTLDTAAVDLVAAGTAFHWFDVAAVRCEFARILRLGGRVALFWNLRSASDAFMRDLDAVLDAHCEGYRAARAQRSADEHAVRTFFDGGRFEQHAFANDQVLDFDGLLGRVRSSSYAPLAGAPGDAPLQNALGELFDTACRDRVVTMRYETRLYLGTLS